MRPVIVAVIVLVAAAALCHAAGEAGVRDALGVKAAQSAKEPASHAAGAPDGREGGETVFDAVPIPYLPYSDSGSTCGHINDYDVACPYTGSFSPDVVYSLVVPASTPVQVDLCNSLYDTKVYIFQDAAYNTIACNDDAGCGYSGYQSRLDFIWLEAGHTYYIVVDGYGGACGEYELEVVDLTGPCVQCPPEAILEGEPDCHDGYVDAWNGGCNSTPFAWQDIAPAAPGGTIRLCGKSGTYSFNGLNYRDTDWFRLTVAETQTITYCCLADFPLLVFFMNGGTQDCLDYTVMGSLTGSTCEEVCLTFTCEPGAYWLWAGPSVFTGIPCGSYYIATISGYEASTPVEGTSWGMIKAMYR